MKKTKRPKPEPAPAKPYECLYHLKIHLLDINPQVYRRFVVKGDTTVVQLHHIVQLVMGGTERIKNTVFPTSYLYFIRLFIWIFIVLCSIILADTLGYWSWLMTWLIGFIYLMTYLNGQSLMNPFANQPTDTPISAIVRTVEINLLQDLGETNLPAPLKPVRGGYLM